MPRSPNQSKTKKVGRSAKYGQFVSKEYVKTHPSTTVTDTALARKKK